MPGAKVPKKAPLSEVSPKKTTNISARNPSANKKAAIKPKNESDDNFDVAIAKFQKNTNPLFIGCTKNGDDHDRHRKKSFDKIIKVVLDSPCVTLYFKKNITTPTDGILNAPCVFVELRGDVTLQKSWHLPSFLSGSTTRQPNSCMSNIRMVLALFNQCFSWRYNLDNFDFPIGVSLCLNKLFQLRAKVHRNAYSTTLNRQVLEGNNSVKQLNLSMFDEHNPHKLTMKMIVIMGSRFGLHGAKEHAKLLVRYIKKRNFELEHPLAGQKYFSLQFMPSKTTKLTNTNTILRAQQLHAHSCW